MKIKEDSRFSAAEDRGRYSVCGVSAAKLMSFISLYLPLSPSISLYLYLSLPPSTSLYLPLPPSTSLYLHANL